MLRFLLGGGALFVIIAASVGCGSSGAEEEPSTPAPTVSCSADARLDSYSGELDKSGELGVVSFRFFDLEPSPPAKGNNTFHVQLSLADGEPMQADLRVDLRMPDHGHGTSVEPRIMPEAEPGTYTVTPLYLFMPGVWRLEFSAFDAAAEAAAMPDESMIDQVLLYFCVEG
jgi:hypothetical protein